MYFTIGFVMTAELPLIFVCGYLIYVKQIYDQTLINSIDCLLLSLLHLLLMVLDTAGKDQDYF